MTTVKLIRIATVDDKILVYKVRIVAVQKIFQLQKYFRKRIKWITPTQRHRPSTTPPSATNRFVRDCFQVLVFSVPDEWKNVRSTEVTDEVGILLIVFEGVFDVHLVLRLAPLETLDCFFRCTSIPCLELPRSFGTDQITTYVLVHIPQRSPLSRSRSKQIPPNTEHLRSNLFLVIVTVLVCRSVDHVSFKKIGSQAWKGGVGFLWEHVVRRGTPGSYRWSSSPKRCPVELQTSRSR